MAFVNAAGTAMPPMFVAKGKTQRSLQSFNTRAAPSGTMWSYQENGWMTDDLGEQWLNNIFLKHCGLQRPELLILDGHSSHESLAILQRAMEEISLFLHFHHIPPITFNPWINLYLALSSNPTMLLVPSFCRTHYSLSINGRSQPI